jgi:hypothetical protein
MLEMQRLGYFGDGVGMAPGVEDVRELEGELVVYEAFSAASLRLPAHRFVVEVQQNFKIQIHQLTPSAMVALAKYVWAVSSYGREPFVEVFLKHYCLHWQKKNISGLIAQFGSCIGNRLRLFLVQRISGATSGTFGFMWHRGCQRVAYLASGHFVLALLCGLPAI